VVPTGTLSGISDDDQLCPRCLCYSFEVHEPAERSANIGDQQVNRTVSVRYSWQRLPFPGKEARVFAGSDLFEWGWFL
jgi:hypothetical protein